MWASREQTRAARHAVLAAKASAKRRATRCVLRRLAYVAKVRSAREEGADDARGALWLEAPK